MPTIGGAANAYIATVITEHTTAQTNTSVTGAWISDGG